MPSHNLARLEIDDLEIIGYSVAAEETVIALPQLDVCFDIGKAPDQMISINNVLLTHGHIDHCAGIAYYLSHRNFMGQKAGMVLAPENMLKPIRQIISAWEELDGSRIPANLVAVKVGQEYQIKPNLFARVFPTNHTKGSVGYAIIEKRKKLKEEYLQLTGPQIVELKKQGVTIDYPVELPIVSYLGDTQYADFAQLDYVANSKILITECTFYEDEHRERADVGRHMYIDDMAKLLGQMNNEHVIITHITNRTSLADAKKLLKKALGKKDFDKIIFLMANQRKIAKS
ncbi:MAG: MBL fold metallo-hydrolase [Phycisphaerae bacterium]|jgi:ribonuclease Z